jgi:hypothetical protein
MDCSPKRARGTNIREEQDLFSVVHASIVTAMHCREGAQMSGMIRGFLVTLLAIGLISILALPGGPMMRGAESATPSQCVACHTDAAKLKALTPPDPPAAETGEG